MKKRIVKLLMVGLLSCMLVGCGNQQETNNSEELTTTETTTASIEESTEPPHEHTYTESITTEAACEADGIKSFTCECGDSYTEEITATCSVCDGKTSRIKAGTKLALQNFPHALNSPWYDASTGEVYFYTVGTSDPTLEPYTSAFNLLRQHYGISGLFTVGSKFNEYVGSYVEGDVYLSSAVHVSTEELGF